MSVLIDWSELPAALSQHNDVTIRAGTHHVTTPTTISGKTFTLQFEPGAVVVADAVMTAILLVNDCSATLEAPALDGNNLARRGVNAYTGSLTVRGGELRQFYGAGEFVSGIHASACDVLDVSDLKVHRLAAASDGTIGNGAGASRGVYGYKIGRMSVRRCWIEQIGGEEGDGIHVGAECDSAEVLDNTVTGFTRRGIKTQSTARVVGNTVTQGQMGSNGHAGIDAIGAPDSLIVRNSIDVPGCVWGILSSGESALIARNGIAIGSGLIGGSEQRGILVTGGHHSTLAENNIVGGVRAIDIFASNVTATDNRSSGSQMLAGHYNNGSTGLVLASNHMPVTLRASQSVAALNGPVTQAPGHAGNSVL